jgi:hypothetical protein
MMGYVDDSQSQDLDLNLLESADTAAARARAAGGKNSLFASSVSISSSSTGSSNPSSSSSLVRVGGGESPDDPVIWQVTPGPAQARPGPDNVLELLAGQVFGAETAAVLSQAPLAQPREEERGAKNETGLSVVLENEARPGPPDTHIPNQGPKKSGLSQLPQSQEIYQVPTALAMSPDPLLAEALSSLAQLPEPALLKPSGPVEYQADTDVLPDFSQTLALIDSDHSQPLPLPKPSSSFIASSGPGRDDSYAQEVSLLDFQDAQDGLEEPLAGQEETGPCQEEELAVQAVAEGPDEEEYEGGEDYPGNAPLPTFEDSFDIQNPPETSAWRDANSPEAEDREAYGPLSLEMEEPREDYKAIPFSQPRPVASRAQPDASTAVIVNYLDDSEESLLASHGSGQVGVLGEEEDMDIDLLELSSPGPEAIRLEAKPMIPVPKSQIPI